MTTPIIKLTNKQVEVYEEFGSVIYNGGKKYMFLPAWLELDPELSKDGIHTVKIHSLGSLPEELVDLIKSFKFSHDD